jgi:hypothetical protein
LLFSAFPAEAITCDWRQKVGTCSARGDWLSDSHIQFSSNSPCSFIDYRINTFDYYTTVIKGVADEPYERHPKLRGIKLAIEITGCTVFSRTDQARRDETQPPKRSRQQKRLAVHLSRKRSAAAISRQSRLCGVRMTSPFGPTTQKNELL